MKRPRSSQELRTKGVWLDSAFMSYLENFSFLLLDFILNYCSKDFHWSFQHKELQLCNVCILNWGLSFGLYKKNDTAFLLCYVDWVHLKLLVSDETPVGFIMQSRYCSVTEWIYWTICGLNPKLEELHIEGPSHSNFYHCSSQSLFC